jgi:hypothetical protein
MLAHNAFLRTAPNAHHKLITSFRLGHGGAGEMHRRGQASAQQQAADLSASRCHRSSFQG